MKVAIMQPYFFPYLGYWQLMANCDQWIFFDLPQFNKRSWMCRNRILHPDPGKEFQYINLATIKDNFGQRIFNTLINREDAWRYKIISQLETYKNLNAPNYSQVIDLTEKILFSNVALVSHLAEVMAIEVMNFLGKNITIQYASQIKFDTAKAELPGDWALEISKAIGATTYINPPSGVALFDQSKFDMAEIKLLFLKSDLPEYFQADRKFIAGLSILDVLMFNSKTAVASMLDNDYRFFDKASLI